MFCSPHSGEKSRRLDLILSFTAACVCAWSCASTTADGQEIRPRFTLTSSQVVSAMQDRQLPTREVQVRLAAPITAGIANPQLEIQAIALLSPNELRLRLTCRDRSLCLSFFAIATYPGAVDPAGLKIKSDNQPAGTPPPVSAARPFVEAPAPSANLRQPATTQAPILRNGSPASLDFDGDRVHVRIEVICLESGAVGDKIRVTTRDRKQVYVAEIVTPILLKGTF